MNEIPRCGFGADISSIDEESGEFTNKKLDPEDILQDIANGHTVTSIAIKYKIPREAVYHCVALIPAMMEWREGNKLKLSNYRDKKKLNNNDDFMKEEDEVSILKDIASSFSAEDKEDPSDTE